MRWNVNVNVSSFSCRAWWRLKRKVQWCMVQLMGGIRNGISLSINYTVRLEVSAIRLMRWYFRSAPSLSLNSLTILIITVPLHFLLIKTIHHASYPLFNDTNTLQIESTLLQFSVHSFPNCTLFKETVT